MSVLHEAGSVHFLTFFLLTTAGYLFPNGQDKTIYTSNDVKKAERFLTLEQTRK